MFGKIGRTIALLMVVLLAMSLAGCSASNEGDTVVFGGSRVIESGERVDGDLIVLGGNVEVEAGAEVAGDVSVMGGSVQLDGNVGGDIAVMGGSVSTGELSEIGGEVVTLGGDFSRADVGSGLEEVIPEPQRPEPPERPEEPVAPVAPRLSPEEPGIVSRAISGAVGLFGKLMQAVAFGALGLVLTMFMPEHVRRIGNAAEAAPAASMGVGFLASLVVIFLFGIAILASFLLIGIPFVVLIPLATTAAWIIGLIGIGFFFGTRLLKGADIRSPRAPAAAAVGTGTLVLAGNLVGWIPFIGWLFTPLIGFWALGATVLTRGGTQKYPARLMTRSVNTPIGGNRAAGAERPVSPANSSGSGNLFADLANDLGLDEEDLK